MIFKTLFQTLKKKSKKSYNLNLTDKYKNYVQKTQDVIKIINGKSKFKIKKLPHRIVIDKKEKDFSKLFDMVNYKILINRLEKYGIKYQYIDWFKSYLNSWKQHVCYSKGTIPLKEVTCGSPQGSILVPLLSLIFVDDFQHVTKFCKQN